MAENSTLYTVIKSIIRPVGKEAKTETEVKGAAEKKSGEATGVTKVTPPNTPGEIPAPEPPARPTNTLLSINEYL